jgi:hypothetical protein
MKKGLRVLFIATVAMVLFGCVGMRGTLTVGLGSDTGSIEVSTSHIGPFSNNSRFQLEGAIYQSDIEIQSNKVVLTGRGAQYTEIAGDVYLMGNNNDLRKARITGTVNSEGNNNKW